MATQTVKEQVDARIKELQEKKQKELAEVGEKLQEAQTKKEAAGLEMKDATARMDVDAYAAAQEKKKKAQIAIDMYTGKRQQIEAQGYITEAESDKVIDSLLEYEKGLAADFEAAIAEPLKQLAKLQAAYMQEVRATELTITAWQRVIHANYNTRGGTTYFDEFTGQRTHRSPNPVPVHAMPYRGCSASTILEKLLTNGGLLQKYAAGGEE